MLHKFRHAHYSTCASCLFCVELSRNRLITPIECPLMLAMKNLCVFEDISWGQSQRDYCKSLLERVCMSWNVKECMCELRQSQRDYCKSLLERVCMYWNVKACMCELRQSQRDYCGSLLERVRVRLRCEEMCVYFVASPSRIIAGHCLSVYVVCWMWRSIRV